MIYKKCNENKIIIYLLFYSKFNKIIYYINYNFSTYKIKNSIL